MPEQQKDPDRLARLMIPSSKVGQVRLDNMATIERGLGPARIERFNRQFLVIGERQQLRPTSPWTPPPARGAGSHDRDRPAPRLHLQVRGLGEACSTRPRAT